MAEIFAQQMFTVIGLWGDGGVYAEWVLAADAHAAMAMIADQHNNSEDLEILGAMRGDHSITAACEDAGKTAFACDLGRGADQAEGR